MMMLRDGAGAGASADDYYDDYDHTDSDYYKICKKTKRPLWARPS